MVHAPLQWTPSSASAPMITLLKVAPSSSMKTAEDEPVSSSESQGWPLSNSLFWPSYLDPFAITLGLERWTMLPDRDGILSVCAETKAIKQLNVAYWKPFILSRNLTGLGKWVWWEVGINCGLTKVSRTAALGKVMNVEVNKLADEFIQYRSRATRLFIYAERHIGPCRFTPEHDIEKIFRSGNRLFERNTPMQKRSWSGDREGGEPVRCGNA